MSSKISLNKFNNKRNQTKNEKKYIFKYKIQVKNNNNISSILKDSKETKNDILKNNETQKKRNYNYDEEDHYNNEIYNKHISKYKYFFDPNNDEQKYNTISSFNSFQKKYKDIYSFTVLNRNNFNKRRKRSNDNKMDSIEIHSDLNLTYDEKNKKNIFLSRNSKKRLIDKDKNHFMNIIRIFDKIHQKLQYKNNSKYNSRNINNFNNSKYKRKYNYTKNNNINNSHKFSKRFKKKILRRNIDNKFEIHMKSFSQPFIELNNENNTNYHNFEITNKLPVTEHKNITQSKEEEIDLSHLNTMKSLTKNLFYRYSPNTPTISIKSNETNKVEEESENKKNFSNIYIGLNKKETSEKNKMSSIEDNNNNHNDNNNSNHILSNNNNSKTRFRFSNRKTKSMLENNTINNNIESNTKNKEEDEQMKQQDTRTIFKRIDNLKKAKIIDEKNNYKRNFNRFIINKEEKSNIKNNHIINNSKINENENNYNSEYLTKISLGSPIKKDLNISNINKRRLIPISINEKNNHNLNDILSNNNNNFCQRKTSETSKTKNGKSNFNTPNVNKKNILSKNNDIKDGKSVSIFPESKSQIFLTENNQNHENTINKEEQNKEIIMSNRSSKPNTSRINKEQQTKIQINLNKEKQSPNRRNVNINKSLLVSDKKIKEIKTERIATKNRYIFNRFKISKNNNTNTNQNNKINDIVLDNKDEKNALNNNNISKGSNINSIGNKYKNNKENDNNYNKDDKNKNEPIDINNEINDPQIQHSNKFRRTYHHYHENKSISNDKNQKINENGDNIIINSKIKNQIINNTSIDNTKPLNGNENIGNKIENEINDIKQNNENIKKNIEKKVNGNVKKRYHFFRNNTKNNKK